ncbi:MAG: DUF3050 domain-containing protein [Crocinitomicaceae bacterium]|nr:DUF3050 domain-containing protein [Crocinitomicaceae bacterium]
MHKNRNVDVLLENIDPYRSIVINHPAYAKIETIDDVVKFMEHHVFAVWDFMSLLKYLQKELTCTTVPWFPVGHADLRFLINEIVTGEESDINKDGIRMSHFEMYRNAMLQLGADTRSIDRFLKELQNGQELEVAFKLANVPLAAQKMVQSTFSVIGTAKLHVVAAVFTFGREDLIPDMFHGIIEGMTKKYPKELSDFMYYLERHIEVDGGHHSQLALKMVEILCGEDPIKWHEAEQAVIEVLQARAALWTGVIEIIETTY